MSNDPPRETDKASPLLTIIIPFRNEARNLPLLMFALEAQSNRRFEAVFVNNESSDESRQMLLRRGFGVLDVPGSVSDARHRAIEAATTDVVVLLDADHYIGSDFVDGMLKSLPPCFTSAILPERSYIQRGWFPHLLSEERRITELAGRGLPRVFRRDALLHASKAASGLRFGEDAAIRDALQSQIIPIIPVTLFHRDPPSLLHLLRKYMRYGSAIEVNNASVRNHVLTGASTFLAVSSKELVSGNVYALAVVALKCAKFLALKVGQFRGGPQLKCVAFRR